MGHITTYHFKPIINKKQNIHVISIQERIERGQNSVLTAHRTDFYIVQIVTKGRSKHMIDFNDVEVQKGDVVIIKPGQVHKFYNNEDYDGVLIAFTRDFFALSPNDINFLDGALILNNLDYCSKISLTEYEVNTLYVISEKISAELLREPDVYQKNILHNYLANLLMFSERKYSEEYAIKSPDNKLTQSNKLVTDFKKLVSKFFHINPKVSFYASELNVSERTLQKSTMSVVGKSPKEIITEEIILESKRLLVHEVMSIKEISYAVGFEEPNNFTKFFKKYTGISPNQFKAEH